MFDIKPLLQIDPKHELLRWGPLQMRMFFMSEFLPALFEYAPKAYPAGVWPNSILLTQQGRFLWLNDFPEARAEGAKLFQTHILPTEERQKLFDAYHAALKKTLACGKRIEETNLASLSDHAFLELWDEFYRGLIETWTPTIPAELGNYASDAMLKERLRERIKVLGEVDAAMEIMTAPEELSFYQEEEIDLAETDDLDAHQKKYFWLKNSYAGAQVLTRDFFEERKREVPVDIRKRMETHIEEVREKKMACIERYGISEDVVRIADALRIAVEFQDERKKWIFISIHTKQLLVSEVARRLGVDPDLLLTYEYFEIPGLLTGKTEPKDRSSGYYIGYTLQPDRAFTSIRRHLNESEMREVWGVYTAEVFDADATEFRGTTASTGDGVPVRGRARIVFDPSHADFFADGDILITSMTSPEYVFLMKKSGAIVTDTGGLTSHAAIVSRELKKPCIIGTKIATKLLKDGDEIEVDAANGVVRKI